MFVCVAGNGQLSSGLPVRIITCAWVVFALMIICLYLVLLTRRLPVETSRHDAPPIPISTAEELSMQTEVQYGVVNGGAADNFFKVASTPVYDRMWSYMTRSGSNVNVDSIQEGLDRVRHNSQHPYVFIMDSSVVADYHTSRLPCDLVQVGSALNSYGLGIAVSLGSVFKARLRLALLEFHENGLIQDLHNKWFISATQCPSMTSQEIPAEAEVDAWSDVPAGSVSVLAGPLLFLISGVVVAVLLCVIRLIQRRKNTTSGRDQSDKENQDTKLTEIT